MLKSGKILVIDDELDFLETVSFRLESAGYEVSTAVEGLTGIKKAKDENPDLILLDIMMPGIDGFETLKRLKSDPVAKRIPVVVFSCGSEEEAWANKTLALGGSGYIVKPFDAGALLFTVDKFMKK